MEVPSTNVRIFEENVKREGKIDAEYWLDGLKHLFIGIYIV